MDEKELFTLNRKRQYLINGGTLVDLEKQWGKYCFLPLDIPKFSESNKIVDWFFQKAKDVKKIKSDIASPYFGVSQFKSVDIFVNRDSNQTGVWETNINHDFLIEFPKFYQELMDLFPFTDILYFSFWQSTADIPKHRDDDDFRDFPNSFRSMLYDDNPEETLYLEEWLPDNTDETEKKCITIPKLEETQSFVWNNLRTKHFSKYKNNHKKIILIPRSKGIDYKKYNQLLEKSLSKYSNYAMISDYSINDFINNPYKFSNLPKNELFKILKKDRS